MPRATYFPKLEKHDTSMYMLGWGGAITDAETTLHAGAARNGRKGDGDYNYGRYTTTKFDELTDAGEQRNRPEEARGDRSRRRCRRTRTR